MVEVFLILSLSSPAGMRQRSLLMTVASVLTGPPRNLSSLGTKYDFINLFAAMSKFHLSICPNRNHRLSRMVIEIGFSFHLFIQRFVCYIYWVFYVKDLFELLSVECI